MKHLLSIAIAASLLLTVAPRHARADDGAAGTAPEFVVKVGVHAVDPKSDNGTLAGGTLKAQVGSDVRPTITGEWMATSNWGVEVLASLPWQHDVKLNGAKAATTDQLPPTLSLQYHFNPAGTVSPFVGLGLNWTLFFNEHTTGPLAGTKLKLDDTLGPAAHAGLDFHVDPRWTFTVDARWIHIDPTAKVNGSKVGTVHIDPMVYGVAVGYAF